MSVNRSLWKPPYSKFPAWPCPRCQTGSLSLKKDTFQVVEPAYSIGFHSELPWEPDWIIERFSGLLACQNENCGEVVSINGFTRHIENHDWERQEQNWDRQFEPIALYPSPFIFSLAQECPESVTTTLKQAFLLFWSDTGSSANRLRAAVEALLSDKGIPVIRAAKGKKRVRLSLHERINLFGQDNSEAAEILLAIKWLGNAGSHKSTEELNKDDLLDGFELFEHAIDAIYTRHAKRLKKMAQAITARKGKAKRP